MLVLNNKATFTKPPEELIFIGDQGEEAQNAIKTLIETGEPQTFGYILKDESTRSNGFEVF